MLTSDLITIVVVCALVLVAMRWLEQRFSRKQIDCDEKIKELEHRISALWHELQAAYARISELEGKGNDNRIPAKPLLLICGPDNRICDSDRHALRRAQISFQRILEATKEKVSDELQRRRQAGDLYKWVHITAHANNEGIGLMDGIAAPGFWNEVLDGVEVVFLAACSTARIADEIAGMVTVVYVSEDIGDKDASAFTYAFWRRMREHDDAVKAYRQAISEATQVAEFTDIRTR